jgi:hypothetical protein
MPADRRDRIADGIDRDVVQRHREQLALRPAVARARGGVDHAKRERRAIEHAHRARAELEQSTIRIAHVAALYAWYRRRIVDAVEIIGPIADAGGFVRSIVSLLERYAAAIDTHGLCPYLRAGGLGDVIVVLDRALDLELACGAIARTRADVIHLVFPLTARDASDARAFERFGNAIATRVRARGSVHAAFHPALAGGREDADRRIGLVRRSPDPFVQLVPVQPELTRSPIARAAFDLDMLVGELAVLHAARLGLGDLR